MQGREETLWSVAIKVTLSFFWQTGMEHHHNVSSVIKAKRAVTFLLYVSQSYWMRFSPLPLQSHVHPPLPQKERKKNYSSFASRFSPVCGNSSLHEGWCQEEEKSLSVCVCACVHMCAHAQWGWIVKAQSGNSTFFSLFIQKCSYFHRWGRKVRWKRIPDYFQSIQMK